MMRRRDVLLFAVASFVVMVLAGLFADFLLSMKANAQPSALARERDNRGCVIAVPKRMPEHDLPRCPEHMFPVEWRLDYRG